MPWRAEGRNHNKSFGVSKKRSKARKNYQNFEFILLYYVFIFTMATATHASTALAR